MYDTLAEESVLYTTKGTINAVNAAARVKKLLQLVSGAVYNEDGQPTVLHDERYELVMTLVGQRKHSLVAYNWKHERDALIKIAEREKELEVNSKIGGIINVHTKTDKITEKISVGGVVNYLYEQ